MAPTLKRTHLRELALNRSCTDVVKSKVRSSEFVYPRDGTLEDKRTERSSQTHLHHYHHYHHPPSRVASRPKRPCHKHPIDTLPSELLAHIFVLGSSLFSDAYFPITVSHVCGVWRDIALRTPALWRRISLTSNSYSNCKLDMWLKRIHRTKACSLDIELGVRVLPAHLGRSPRQPHFDIHAVQWYMHLVLPSIHRWRSLRISFAHYAPFLWNAALSACCETGSSIHAPLIEELSLTYPVNDDTKEFTLFEGVAPRLKRLTIDGIWLAWLPSLFQNLTFLEYTHRGPIRGTRAVSLVLSMLEVSNRLQELRLCFSCGRDLNSSRSLSQHPRPHRRILLPLLTTLQLCIDGSGIPNELSTLLPLLSFPSLAFLHLTDSTHSPRPFAHLSTFLRVFCIPLALKYLCMDSGWVDHRMLPSLFRSLKVLRRAVISGACLPDPYFVGFEVSRTHRDVFVVERVG